MDRRYPTRYRLEIEIEITTPVREGWPDACNEAGVQVTTGKEISVFDQGRMIDCSLPLPLNRCGPSPVVERFFCARRSVATLVAAGHGAATQVKARFLNHRITARLDKARLGAARPGGAWLGAARQGF